MLWPRLRFGDGGTLDLEPVSEWDRELVEAEWRAVHVKIEWLRSPKGRLDRALDFIVAPEQPSEGDSLPSPE
jgi:hypothetical protein